MLGHRRIALLAIAVVGAVALTGALAAGSPAVVSMDDGSPPDAAVAPAMAETTAGERVDVGATVVDASTPSASAPSASTPSASARTNRVAATNGLPDGYDEEHVEVDVLVPARNPRSDETVTVYVAVHDTSGPIFQPVAGADVEVRIAPDEWDVDPEGHVKRVNVTTDEQGYAAVEYDFEGHPDARYEFEASTGSIDGDDGVSDMKIRSAGVEAYSPDTTSKAIVGAEVNDFLAYHDGRLPVQDHEERMIVTNDAGEELANESVVADAAGVVSIPFVPEDTGYFGAASGVNYSVGLAPAIDMQLADDRTAIAGRVVGPDGPAANQEITLQLKEGYQETVEERNVTTDDRGWFETEFDAVPASSLYRFEAQTPDGAPVYVRPERAAITLDPSLDRGAPLFNYPEGGYGEGGYAIDGYGSPNGYQRPYDTSADPTDVQLDVRFADDEGSWTSPGSRPTVVVEGTYGDGSPAAGETVDVGVYLHRGIRSATVTNGSVTLGDDGTATLEASVPADAPEGTYALAAGAHADGGNATVDHSGALKIQRYVTDVEGLDGPVTPGETETFEVHTYGPDGEPVEGAPITAVALTHLNERYADGDFARTDADGRATLEVEIPEDVEQRVAIRFMGEYTRPVFSPAVRLPVKRPEPKRFAVGAFQIGPDESVNVSYATDRGDASALVRLRDTETGLTTFGTVAEGDGSVALPAAASAGDTYDVRLVARDGAGELRTAETTVEVVDAPVRVDLRYEPDDPTAGEPVTFDGTGSVAVEGEIDRYEWSFGENVTANGSTAQHTFAEPGTYPVTLTVVDGANESFHLTRTVTVAAATDDDDGTGGGGGGGGGYGPVPSDGESQGSPNLSVAIEAVPEDVEPGQNGTIVLSIANDGDAAGTYEGTLQIDAEPVADLRVEVEPNGSVRREVAYDFADPGTYTVAIDGETARIEVEAASADGSDSGGDDPGSDDGTSDDGGQSTDGADGGAEGSDDGNQSAGFVDRDLLVGSGGIAVSIVLGSLALVRRDALP